ncbi:sigma-70 family RNA polymerase sigma factor [Pseudenhygromyxa sp. WMMC2535]|uniref:RNA polymerase sigma factor n=1 Tax=Pseudenhygromyxa sp. WMMC2535 TaxID=2712867 RepID=UPI001554AAF9|nr:sigma-70 family RNA polymerase sigma factor [Pseudenhygromyxa sp. WMMC2535]NVB41777.1 sigma-70 family RNA polymerase sigma factor [Pseudenhygromyxa sp. WMMC2535]
MVDDLELAQRWRDGDDRAGSILFERHYDSIECFFRNKVDSGLEDLLQRTFLIALEGRDRFRGASSYRTYLFGVAYNVLRNHYRAKRRERDRLDFGHHSVADLAPGASTMLRGEEQQARLLQALRSIPLDYQVVLELHYWEEMDGKAIAAALDIPHGTARSRLRIGRQRLVQALEAMADSGVALDETLTKLDDWARALRERLVGEPAP